MDVVLLFKSIVGLVVVLGLLVLALLFSRKKQKKEQEKVKKEEAAAQKVVEDAHSFEKLSAVIKQKGSSTEELKEALELIMKYYPTMHKKLGLRAHPESDVYMDLVFKLCRHKNANKKIIIQFMNDLEKNNPEYTKEINDAMMRGLNSRGI